MTLSDLIRLIRHYRKTAVAVLVSSLLVAVGIFALLPPRYEASSTITAIDPTGKVPAADMLMVANDYVQDAARPYRTGDSDAAVSVSLGTGYSAKMLTITVEGPSGEECVAVSNSIANQAAKEATAALEELQRVYADGNIDLSSLNNSEDVASVLSGTVLQNSMVPDLTFDFCSYSVGEAEAAEKAGLGLKGLLVVGLVGGLFLVVLSMALIDMVKCPIRSSEELEEMLGVPVVVGSKMSDLADRVWASIQFSCKAPIGSVCLISLSGDSSDAYADSLGQAIERVGRSAVVADPEGEWSNEGDANLSVQGATVLYRCASPISCIYCAHDAEVSVVYAHLWESSRKDLRNVLRQLSFANAPTVLVGLLSSEK